MIEILRDGLWQFIGAALAAFAIALSILLHYAQRKRKELAFGVISNRNLLTVSEELEQRVTVYFDGKSVPNLQMIVFGLKNSGNTEVLIGDFESPITVTLGGDARILSADVLQISPVDLPCRVSHTDSELIVPPLLLNR